MNRRDFIRFAGATFINTVLVPGTVLAASEEWVDKWWSTENINGESLPEEIKPGGHNIETKYCDGRLRLKSSIHGESYEFRFRDTAGNYNQQVLSALNWFLRCRDGCWQYMDIRAIETLNYLSALLGVPEIQINSGYRSPQYNLSLATRNENVARNSLHQYGQALDFLIPGMSTKEVCSYTLFARNTMGYGGVGYYPNAGFVHLDSGRKKQWVK